MEKDFDTDMIEEYEPNRFFRICANVDLDAIRHNICKIKRTIGNDVKLMAVIKADGYGHGAVPIAKELEDCADLYGVAIIEEAIQLRKAGIKKDIMILGAVFKEQIHDVVAYDVIAPVFSYEMADAFHREAKKQNKAARLHVKVDTGMGRIGLKPDSESVKAVVRMSKLSCISLEGIFTHFACADHNNKSSAHRQYKLFDEFIHTLEESNVNFQMKHASNSAAIVDMPETYLNLVRSGITTYGLYPSDEVRKENIDLKPAMNLKTHISHLKYVEKGCTIGYGSTFETMRESVIATIPAGYADGYPRGLSNKGYVLIKGKKAAITGRVCMDQFMVDVTDIKGVAVGDEVTLIGRDGDEWISVEELSDMFDSFNYEFICNISKRVPRIYHKNNIPFIVKTFLE